MKLRKRTTKAIRRTIQSSTASSRTLAARYGINIKTVLKWRKRTGVQDAPLGKAQRVLSAGEEAIIVGFRRHTLLPLDDCLYALQATIPQLTRTSLYRCLQRYGISQIRGAKKGREFRMPANSDAIGCFRIAINLIRTTEQPLALFLAIDRTSKFVYSQMCDQATAKTAIRFLKALMKAVPYRIHTVVTENGPPFGKARTADAAGPRHSAFGAVCADNRIEHLLTAPNYPWTHEQVVRMRQLLTRGTAGHYHYFTRDAAIERSEAFRRNYNFGRRLKSLRGRTPHAFICRVWQRYPERFWVSPLLHTWI